MCAAASFHADTKGRREASMDYVPERAAFHGDAAAEQRDELLRGLAGLGRFQRAIVVLRYWDDRSVDEVAGMLSLWPGTVRSHSARGLSRLRVLLGDPCPFRTATALSAADGLAAGQATHIPASEWRAVMTNDLNGPESDEGADIRGHVSRTFHPEPPSDSELGFSLESAVRMGRCRQQRTAAVRGVAVVARVSVVGAVGIAMRPAGSLNAVVSPAATPQSPSPNSPFPPAPTLSPSDAKDPSPGPTPTGSSNPTASLIGTPATSLPKARRRQVLQ